MTLQEIAIKRSRIELTVQERLYLLRGTDSGLIIHDRPILHWITQQDIHSMDKEFLVIELDKLEIPKSFTIDQFTGLFNGLYKTGRNFGLITHDDRYFTTPVKNL